MTFSKKRVGTAQNEVSPAKIDSLFQQHWTRLCLVLFRLVGDQAEAEDLALDAFWRLYRRPPGSDHNLAGWLYRVGVNLGYNALRARQRRQHYEMEAARQEIQRQEPTDPELLVERAQERERVRLVLARMKPRSAQLLILRHSGLSYAEIATALEISPGSVGTLLARAEREFEERYLNQERS
jgi:RNA polymerase sigma-70 factor (ECF subfamily)